MIRDHAQDRDTEVAAARETIDRLAAMLPDYRRAVAAVWLALHQVPPAWADAPAGWRAAILEEEKP